MRASLDSLQAALSKKSSSPSLSYYGALALLGLQDQPGSESTESSTS